MRYLSLVLLLCTPHPGEAQTVDEGTFSIRAAGREIGREDFALRSTRQGGAPGSTIISRVRIPAVTPQFTQEAILERRADGSLSAIQVIHQSPARSGRVLAEVARNTLRIHSTSGGSEAIKEIPASADMIGLADSAYALFASVAELATPEGRQLTAVFPVNGKRVPFTAQKLGGDAGGGVRILLAGEIVGTLWMDGSGHLTRMEFPQSGIEIVRLRR